MKVMNGQPVEPKIGLTQEQLVSQILSINPSATRDFLARFGQAELNSYLSHLENAQLPRGRGSSWSRPGDTPPIVVGWRRAS